MLRVLLVEDDPVLSGLLREYLEGLGYAVVAAADGADALARVLHEGFDLVICDLVLPKLSGEEFCDQLLKHRPEMASRILIVTGDILSEQAAEFLQRTGLPCVPKPFGLKELSATLGDLLGSDEPPTTSQ